MQTNPILLEVFKNRFSSIAEEMGVTLTHTAFSPNIKERQDLSCAVFDRQGDMIAQAAHIPVHLGSMPLSVKSAMESVAETGGFNPGDMVMLNDPFKGGTHLPDITIVAPVFSDDGDTPMFFVANRAHHADVGGIASGSMPLSTSLFQEGLIIPPVRIIRQGRVDKELMRLVLNNVRTPTEREGDFSAQFMANVTGVRRMEECIQKYGLATCTTYGHALMDYSERITRQAIEAIPDGNYEFEDFLDDDGQGTTDIRIHLLMEIKGDSAQLDFSESANQVRGSVNAVRAITLSAVLYVFQALAGRDIPANAGCMRPISVITRPGSVVDARFPAAVAGGNVETSQRMVDVILGSLSKAMPDRMPAASQGTMNNLTIGGETEHGPFAYYETLAGGMGAAPGNHGESAVHSHMTNTLNTPVEALEYAYPFRVCEYAIKEASGGRGKFDGGNGMVREIELLRDCEITVLSERRTRGAFGVKGGEPGKPGRNQIIGPATIMELPGKFHRPLSAGDRVRIETPGGGGFGKPDKS